jgi:hypothetical protein
VCPAVCAGNAIPSFIFATRGWVSLIPPIRRLLLAFSADTGEVFRVGISTQYCGHANPVETSPQPAP